MQKVKMPKIKIPEQDIRAFGMDSLKINPFWNDLYGINSIEEEEEEEEHE